jgi:C4-dicarboxylate-specific signal transduction histidine kinase
MLPTEPIGSIPRPAALIEGVQAFRAGRISQPKLNALYNSAVQDTIRLVEATGSPVIRMANRPSTALPPIPSMVYTGLATSVAYAVTALRGHLAEDLAYGVTALRARAERKRAEDALHQAREELAHVTRVTTLGELAASIAHEVNQPLAAIVADANACLHWLEADRPPLDSVREALAAVVNDGNRAGEVIARIRALLSRASVAHRPCDLGDVIRDVLLLVGPELGRHGTVLQTSLATHLPPVMGDRVQLQQVLLNLLLNAAEAVREVPPERRRLVVRSALEQREDGPWAVVAVADAGVGFREEEAARLFEAFYTTKAGGLGMGLSISRSIMDGHRGRLWATANQGHGATFHFALPGMR